MKLLINDSPPSEHEPLTRFGGFPAVPDKGSVEWPGCRACNGPMQFLGQLRVPASSETAERLLLIFMCQNEPGMCDEWEADNGGNSVLVIDASQSMKLLQPPVISPATIRGAVNGALFVESEVDDYDLAREEWANAHDNRRREVLGQVSGPPSWIQAGEVPACNACSTPMRFVAQLEEGPGHETAMNFGGGCAYVFDCSCDSPTGKLLWQCG